MSENDERQEQSGLKNAAETAQKGRNAVNTAKKAKNAYNKYRNAQKNAQTAKTAAKAGAKFAAGDIAGGATELAKDEKVQKLVIGIVAVVVGIIMMFFSAITSVIYLPVEEDQGEQGIVWVVKHPIAAIKHWFGFESEEYSLIDENTIAVPGEEDVAPDGERENNPTDHASNSINEMLEETTKRYQKRHEAVLKAINEDFILKQASDTNVYKTVIDPISSGSTTIEKEAVRLMSLYSAQTDTTILDSDFETYLAWLGEKEFFLWSKQRGDDENDPEYAAWNNGEWNKRPEAWSGSMLSQPDIDKLNDWEKANPDTEYDTNDNPENLFFTSALEQVCAIYPEITKDTFYTYEHVYDDDGNIVDTVEVENTEYTYTIKSNNSSSESTGVLSFVQFSSAKNANKPAEPAFYRKENYEDMIDNTCEFFDINDSESIFAGATGGGSGSGGGGGSGSGNSLVEMALSQVGYLEKASNSQLDDKTANAGSANYTKYGRDFGMNGVAWCNIFVSWCATQCGLSSDIIPQSASCQSTYDFYASKGLTYSTSSSYTPKPGDLVLRGPGNHIGIVEKYEGGTLYTIEGNTSGGAGVISEGGGVFEKSYSNPASSWTYYCSVQYPAEATGGSGVAGNGEYVDVPAQYGIYETYEFEVRNSSDTVDHGWANWGPTSQGGIREDALKHNRLREGNIFGLTGCAIMDNRLMIATTPNIGGQLSVSIGDYLDVTFSDGTVWNCILGDEKGSDADSSWGHDGGQGVVEIIYWDNSGHSGNQYKKVTRITKVGSYFNN